eukprot:1367908-Pyramimonas_sp.AAC.1
MRAQAARARRRRAPHRRLPALVDRVDLVDPLTRCMLSLPPLVTLSLSRGCLVCTHRWGVDSTLAVIGTGGPVKRSGSNIMHTHTRHMNTHEHARDELRSNA